MDEEKSRLQGFRVAELLITKTLVGKGVDGSPIRNLFQIWTEDSMLIATVDHGDNAYSVIESIFRGGREK